MVPLPWLSRSQGEGAGLHFLCLDGRREGHDAASSPLRHPSQYTSCLQQGSSLLHLSHNSATIHLISLCQTVSSLSAGVMYYFIFVFSQYPGLYLKWDDD